MGWNFAGQHSPEFAIYCQEDGNDEELHTDSVVLNRSLRTKMILQFSSSLVLFSVAIIVLFSKWGLRSLYEIVGRDFSFYQPIDYFLWGDVFVAIPLCFFYALLAAGASLIRLMRMARRIKQGNFPMREIYSKKKAKIRVRMKLCLYLLAATAFFYCFAACIYVI